ncbi:MULTISPECIES: motility protein A [Halomonadaceae]|uniref:Chemotaxis protein MotA n=1 Tax=Vreelandella halophila TaxID=86177 RepID=A0A9X4Y9J2_9GAMM|nr:MULTISPECIES: MotA/TolQ/ExbB proton channel family protein [Halomonas]MYL25852.1 chemotaxis protein MotA [Halomonas utahensis]MYL73586.1 chemotaxis protein MotA [Halomonas sp. 22501_18_FS]
MNPSTLIGILGGLGLFATIFLNAVSDPSLFINLPGLGIVIGGTLAATFISYPIREVLSIFRLIGTVLRNERLYTEDDIEELMRITRLFQTGQMPAVEKELQNVNNPFLRTGIQLAVDLTPEEDVLDLMQWRIARLQAKEHAEAQLFRVMAGFAPAFGMIGTLVGLINMMFQLGSGDMELIGQSLAVALMTTFYGILLANLVLKPIAVKLERRTEQRMIVMHMVMQGVSMMFRKRRPTLMRETLNSFVADHINEIRDGNGSSSRQGLFSKLKDRLRKHDDDGDPDA